MYPRLIVYVNSWKNLWFHLHNEEEGQEQEIYEPGIYLDDA